MGDSTKQLLIAYAGPLVVLIGVLIKDWRDKQKARSEKATAQATDSADIHKADLVAATEMRNDWVTEVRELRARADRQDELIRKLTTDSATQAISLNGQIAALTAELSITKVHVASLTTERDGLKDRVKELEQEVQRLKQHNKEGEVK